MDCQAVEEYCASEIKIHKGDKFASEDVKNAVIRINQAINWSEENEEIFQFFDHAPRLCYFAQLRDDIAGYVILREAGEDRHLHISWIATDVLNRGIGTLLMHKVMQKSRKIGKKIVTLYFRADNEKLKKFYEKIALIEGAAFSCEDDANKKYKLVTYRLIN